MAGGLPPELVDETRRALDAVVSLTLPAEEWNAVGDAFMGIDSAVKGHDASGVRYWLSMLETATPGGRSAWTTSAPPTDSGASSPPEPTAPTEFTAPPAPPLILESPGVNPSSPYGSTAGSAAYGSVPHGIAAGSGPYDYGAQPTFLPPPPSLPMSVPDPASAPPPMAVRSSGTRRGLKVGAVTAGAVAFGAAFGTVLAIGGGNDATAPGAHPQSGSTWWEVALLIGGLAVLAAATFAAIVLQRKRQRRPPPPSHSATISSLMRNIEPPRLHPPEYVLEFKNRTVISLNALGG